MHTSILYIFESTLTIDAVLKINYLQDLYEDFVIGGENQVKHSVFEQHYLSLNAALIINYLHVLCKDFVIGVKVKSHIQLLNNIISH